MPWETAKPVTVEVTIETQCQPLERRTRYISQPIHEICQAMHKHGDLRPYQIQQALSSLSSFWAKVAGGDANPEDYDGPG